jgi:hypothetical protein
LTSRRGEGRSPTRISLRDFRPPPKGAVTFGLLALSFCLAACQSAQTDYLAFESPQAPVTTAARIAENVGPCWFGGGRAAFADYSYAPELASVSNRPRVLIVDKTDPTGLPKLVIEAVEDGRGSSVRLFGPLMATSEAPTIRRDVERWAEGGSGCS